MKKLLLRLLLLGMAAVLSGCSLILSLGTENKTTESRVGDTVSTAWFDYTISSAEAVDAYKGYTAAGGNKLVVVELTMKNTFREPVPMYDTDFQLYWGEHSQEEMAFPLAPYCNAQLSEVYQLDLIREGVLVYEVPAGIEDFMLVFQEVFDNGTDDGEEGDLFVTHFIAV